MKKTRRTMKTKPDTNPVAYNETQEPISLCGTGPVYRLEKKFAALLDHPYALTVTNATLGLWAVFDALNIHDADVVCPPYTWGGSIAGLLQAGNRPMFVDINPDTLTLDPKKVQKAITPETRAILAVDIYGNTCDGEPLRRIAETYNLWLIQDCAQSFGAYRDGYHTGRFADASVFSFGWGKQLHAGEGGIIVTPHRDLFEELVLQTQHPMRQMRDVPERALDQFALNMRIHPAAAVMAEKQFDLALDRIERHRKQCFEILKELDAKRMRKSRAPEEKDAHPSFHTLTIDPPQGNLVRTTAYLRSRDFALSVPPVAELLYQQAAYIAIAARKGWEIPSCPVAEAQCRSRIRITRTG